MSDLGPKLWVEFGFSQEVVVYSQRELVRRRC